MTGLARDVALRLLAARFAAADLPDAGRDARVLLCAAAGIRREDLLRDPGIVLSAAASDRLEGMAGRRLAREPVSRILGRRAFWTLDLDVTAAVLDPRADSETVIAAALQQTERRGAPPATVLDLGTGSGALLAALLTVWPQAWGVGVDISPAAAMVARDNLRAVGTAARGVIFVGDWADAIGARFDLIVSNPPYIETDAIAGLDPEVRAYDPRLALDGGTDGLACYRALRATACRLLAPGGALIVEIGMDQGPAVEALFQSAGLRRVATHHDVAGHARALVFEASSRA